MQNVIIDKSDWIKDFFIQFFSSTWSNDIDLHPVSILPSNEKGWLFAIWKTPDWATRWVLAWNILAILISVLFISLSFAWGEAMPRFCTPRIKWAILALMMHWRIFISTHACHQRQLWLGHIVQWQVVVLEIKVQSPGIVQPIFENVSPILHYDQT